MRRLLSILLLLCAAPALAVGEWGLADYGYEARANGMDWDDDFVYGEATDDGKACDDADTDGATIVVEDIDGDTEDEQQIYVIPATGVDDSNCGGPNATDACATVMYVLANRMDTDTDATTEDIICLVGTAHEALQMGAGAQGPTGTKTRTATGDEVYDFQYPADPNVLMGADRDQDGNYPPFDTDDTAVFDGEVGASYLEIFFEQDYGGGSDGTDRWELAHLTVQEYGTNDATRSRAIVRGMFHTDSPNADTSDHMYFHDIYGYRINYGQESGSYAIDFYDGWGRDMNYHAIENVSCYECCGYHARGNGSGTYFRWRNTSATSFCEDTLGERDQPYGPIGMKLWGTYSYIELLNNEWDHDVTPFAGSRSYADYIQNGSVGFNTCVQDVYVVNNRFLNFGNACLSFGGGLAGQCDSRYADNLNYLRNVCAVTVTEAGGSWPKPMEGIRIAPGLNSTTTYTQDATIANNLFADLGGEGWYVQMFKLTDGVPVGAADPSGYTIAFVNNTGYSTKWGDTGAPTRQAVIMFDDDSADQPHGYVIKNNVVAGGDGGGPRMRWVSSGVGVGDVDMDYNIYEDDGGIGYWAPDGTRYSTLALWSAATGLGTNSKGAAQNACDVTFLNRGSDMHLHTADTCAQDASTSTGDGANAYTTIDFDGDARPQNVLWDIGADEYESGYVPVGACCDSACEVTTDAACDLWEGAGTTCSPDPCESEPPLTPVEGFAEGASFKGVSKD